MVQDGTGGGRPRTRLETAGIVAGIAAALLAIPGFLYYVGILAPGPSPTTTMVRRSAATTTPSTSATVNSTTTTVACPSGRVPLANLPIESGTPPEIGIGNIGGESFPNSIIYPLNGSQDSLKSTFDLCGRYSHFTATVGFNADANLSAQLLEDGTRVLFAESYHDSPPPQSKTPVQISVDIPGAHSLTLEVNLECCNTIFTWGAPSVS